MSTDLTTTTNKYDLASVAETAASWREELGDDFVPEFPRIKVPGGGATVWEDDEGNPHKTLIGVIVGFHKSTRLYLEKLEGSEAARPDAWSVDGKTQVVPQETIEKAQRLGLPIPLTNLALCPYYQWDSTILVGGSGKGKATREYREVYLLLENHGVVPFHLSVPATSIRDFDKYAQSVVMRKGSLSAVETVFGLERQDGGGSVQYSTVTFARGDELSPSDAAAAKQYARQVRALVTQDPFVVETRETGDSVVTVGATITTEESDTNDTQLADRVENESAAATTDSTPVESLVAAGGVDIDSVDF